MPLDHIDTIRRFNRAVTQRVGALQDSYLSRGRPLGEARLIFEIGRDGADIRDLRAKLNLDSGYLSRLLRSLEAQGLISVDRADGDARVRRAALTLAGQREWDGYDRSSDDLARSILDPLDAGERGRLVAAMREVERLLGAASIEIAVEPPDNADARWCLTEYFKELAVRFEEGFDLARGNKLSEAEMAPPAGYFLIARREGRAVGCAALIRIDEDTAEIKRMWTSPVARGQGVARRMLRKLEAMAREKGFRRLVLDTNRALKEAHALYRGEGFTETTRYNDNPYADYWFEKVLVD
jgi:DNA-binding MarR family transcriptional regulator/GNAT superfamily N-acetyltransferase